MPEIHEVTKVNYKGQKDNPHGGVLHKFYVTLVDQVEGTTTHDVYWQRKSPDLSVGEQFYGHIEQGEYGPRFKTDQRPDGSGNQGSSGGTFTASRYQKEGITKDDYWQRKEDRDRESQARQGRAHAQEMSLRWAAIQGGDVSLKTVMENTDWFHDDVQRFPLDADVGGGHGTDAPLAPAADVSAERPGWTILGTGQVPVSVDLGSSDRDFSEASPAQKRRLTQEFTKAGLSRDAMKAVVFYRCRSEKATKDGASQLIQDLTEGATAEALLAEIWDAHRAGNDPVATRASKLIPSDVPLAPEPVEVVEPNGEKDIPF